MPVIVNELVFRGTIAADAPSDEETPSLPASPLAAGAGGAEAAAIEPAVPADVGGPAVAATEPGTPAGATGAGAGELVPGADPDPFVMGISSSAGEAGSSEETEEETLSHPTNPLAVGATGVGASELIPGTGPDPVVMQVRSSVATYWRGRTYSVFDSQHWLPDSGVAMEPHVSATRRRYTQTFFLREPQETLLVGYSPLKWQLVGGSSEASALGAGDVYSTSLPSIKMDSRP